MRKVGSTNSKQFLSDLVETCQKDKVIREDGKSVNFFNRIIDLFLRRHKNEHFRAACENLSEFSDQFSALPADQKIEVLGRFKEVTAKIKNNETKIDCNILIEIVEKKTFKDQPLSEFIKPVFEDIETASKNHNIQIRDHGIRKFEVILEYFDGKENDVIQIANLWMKWVESVREQIETSKIDYKDFYESGILMQRKIMETEKKFLDKDGYSNELINNFTVHLFSNLEYEYNHHNREEVFVQINLLKNLFAQNSSSQEFLEKSLKLLDDFLKSTVFKESNITLPEFKKTELLMLGGIFEIADKYIPLIQDQKLINNLKIKCANLPCPSVRSAFPNLFLSNKDQLDILLQELQRLEENEVNSLIESLKEGRPSHPDISRLAKLLGKGGGLNESNLQKLRDFFSVRLGELLPVDWNDYLDVNKRIEKVFLLETGKTVSVDKLKRLCRSKEFFQKQLGLGEDLILIPRWYHATSRYAVNAILQSGEIQVQHRKAYRGAWISTNREPAFGDHVISLSDKVTNLDPNVFIGFTYQSKRWRGLQKAIPLKSENETSNIALVGVPEQYNYEQKRYDRAQQKITKLKIVRTLKEKGFPDPKAFSVKQVDFIQTQVMRILGTPNLPDIWWGAGRAYSEHQVKLHETIEGLPIDSKLFEVKESIQETQIAIGKIIQTAAIPIYKEPMPENASYRSDATSTRIEVGYRNDRDYRRHLEKIAKKETPARGDHGTMHAVRVALWTQVLARLYERLGREKVDNPILLATAGAFHDSARENEGIDQWDGESAELYGKLLSRTAVDQQTKERYQQTIREKDPKNNEYSSDVQRIVHDADCLDIIRVIGKFSFNRKHLNFYNFDPAQRKYCDKIINEITRFIQMTENFELRNTLEHQSEDFYGDLVKLLFSRDERGKSKFPLITELIKNDMEGILANTG